VHWRQSPRHQQLLDLIVFGRAAALRAAELIKPGSPVRNVNGSEDRALGRSTESARARRQQGRRDPATDAGDDAVGLQRLPARRHVEAGLDKMMALREPVANVTVDEPSLQ